MKLKTDIIGKYLSGNCSPEEVQWVQEQLTSSAEFKSEYESLSHIWELTNKLSYDSSPTEGAWQEFKAKVKAPTRGIGFDWLKVAASIVLLAAFSVFMYQLTGSGQSYTSASSEQEWTLDDGSNIVLSSNSTLKTSRKFNEQNRNVVLEGEGYFDVSSAKESFVIALNGGTLTVVGTEFNLFNPEDADYVSLELYEGEVLLEFGDRKESISAGNRVIWDGEALHVSSISTQAPAWLGQQEIYCQNVSLEHIMLQLQKQYSISYKLPRKSLKERYTVSLPKDNLTACMELISGLTQLDLQLSDQHISLR